MKKYIITFIFGILAIGISIKFNSFAMQPVGYAKLDQNMLTLVSRAQDLYLANETVDNERTFPEILLQKLEEYYSKYDLPKINATDRAALIEFFNEQESILKKHINDPLISQYGGINYAMSLEEMKTATKDKFKDMKQKGLIISEDEFETIKDLYYTTHHHTDLTRIWGAEYFKKEISKSKELSEKYDVPDYIIVTKNPQKLKVKFWGSSVFPVIGIIEDAAIYFKNIKGKPVGCDDEVKKDIGEGSALDYLDICNEELSVLNWRQNENVIQDDVTGKRYIVDTEFTTYKPKLTAELYPALRYGSKKFQYYNHIYFSDPRRKRIGDTIEYEFELK